MKDEERQKLCKELRADDYDDAADEIERLASELRLAISARDYANDLLAQFRERVSELERKAPW